MPAQSMAWAAATSPRWTSTDARRIRHCAGPTFAGSRSGEPGGASGPMPALCVVRQSQGRRQHVLKRHLRDCGSPSRVLVRRFVSASTYTCMRGLTVSTLTRSVRPKRKSVRAKTVSPDTFWCRRRVVSPCALASLKMYRCAMKAKVMQAPKISCGRSARAERWPVGFFIVPITCQRRRKYPCAP